MDVGGQGVTVWFFSVLAVALCWAGMLALCLAMDRHYEQVVGRREVPRGQLVACRIAGGLVLAIALRVCVVGWGASVGVVAWCGFLTIGALAVALLLPAIPRLGALAASLAGVAAVLVWLTA